jgi:hypothetical protein
MAPAIYNKHPEKACIHTSKKHLADGLQRRGDAAPIPAGDETIWLGGDLDATADLLKILAKRKRLAHISASSTTWPSLWPRVAPAASRRSGGIAVESRTSRDSRMKPELARTFKDKPMSTSSPPRPVEWARTVEEQHRQQQLRLEKNSGPPACRSTRSPFPSPPRPAGRGDEDEADAAGHLSAPRTRADAAKPRPQPDPPITEILLLPSKPPRPDRGSTRETGSEDSEKQTAKPLFREVAAVAPTIRSDQRSKRAAAMNPKDQISP